MDDVHDQFEDDEDSEGTDAQSCRHPVIPRSLDPDVILDTLVPQSIDWRGTVRRHPMVSVVGVGLVGYLVGRTKGAAIMAGLTAGLSSAMMRQLSDVFEGDFFDF